MHEFSIATALVEQVDAHAPAGLTLRLVRVRAGAMRAIEPTAMQWAWHAATQATRFDGAELELIIEPFTLTCDACGRRWESAEMFTDCACGNPRPRPDGSNDMTLEQLTLDDASEQEVRP
jgi:hydrogenase nickel incorporation protein HypA/HybF